VKPGRPAPRSLDISTGSAKPSSPDTTAIAPRRGRVFLFLYTDNFQRDYEAYKSKGIVFVREPKEEVYGTVAVFKDLYGNLWDLLQPKQGIQGAT
jgi:uncharacterized glyoxalase superfamily protein PhnB